MERPAELRGVSPWDPMEDQPLRADISRADAVLYGRLVHAWRDEGGYQVLAVRSGFRMELGSRELEAEHAVIWLGALPAPEGFSDRPGVGQLRPLQRQVKELQIYLQGNVRIRESAGSVTQDSVMMVSVRTIGRPELRADAVSSERPPADWPVLANAQRVREAWLAGASLEAGDGQEAGAAGAGGGDRRGEAVRPVFRYTADQTENEVREGEAIATAIGNVRITQARPGSGEFLDLRADAAVLFLTEDALQDAGRLFGEAGGDGGGEGGAGSGGGGASGGIDESEVDAAQRAAVAQPLAGGLGQSVRAAYLEGDVQIQQGNRQLRASRVYYDFERDRAILLDGVVSSFDAQRGLPLYLRARQMFQLRRQELRAFDAQFTTSEFRTPSYHIGADELRLIDTTPRGVTGEELEPATGQFEAYWTTLNLDGVPLTYWPFLAGDLRRIENPLKSLNISYNGDFGLAIETEWYLATLLGLPEDENIETILRLDMFSKRGPAVGINSQYVLDDFYGRLKTYYIYDMADRDDINFLRREDIENPSRGRVLWQHRQILGDGWELTLEGSVLSDRNFLEQYENDEFLHGKQNENAIYLKKQQDNWALTTLVNFKLYEWLVATEHKPEVAGRILGESVLWDAASYYGEARVGYLRYSGDQARIFDTHRPDNTSNTDHQMRVDNRNELQFPLALGDAKLVPFVSGRYTWWDGGPRREGSTTRYFFTGGLRAQQTFYKVFEGIKDEFWDVDGIRHVVKPDAVVVWNVSNKDAWDLTPFDDGVETINSFGGLLVGLRQRWQTRRGPPGDKRTVDWVTLDIEYAGFVNEDGAFDPYRRFPRTNGYFYTSRPEESLTSDYLRLATTWQASDQALVSYEAKLDMDGFQLATSTLALTVQRTPRFSWFIGHEYVGEINMHLFGYGMNYRLSPKYTVAWRQAIDVEERKCVETTVAIVRKWQRWYTALSFSYDGVDDDVSISFSLWPEGLEQAAIGSRRFMPLASSIALEP